MYDWTNFLSHIAAVVADRGQAIWLHDEDGVPICALPPEIEMVARSTRNAVQELELKISARTSAGQPHRVVNELIADGLGKTDTTGRLVPNGDHARLIVIFRENFRACFRVTHATAAGDDPVSPETITIFGLDELGFLEALPCPSIPGTWGKEPFKDFPRDEGAEFSQPLRMRPISLAAQADGFVVAGPADRVIRDLITRSLRAVWETVEPPITEPPVVVDQQLTGRQSPHVLIRPQDNSILETVAAVAKNAGVVITATLWLPGDEQPAGVTLGKPTIVVSVQQKEVAQ